MKGIISDQGKGNPVSDGQGTYMAVLIGSDQEAPNFIMRRFCMEPGGKIPAHKHPTIEHEQYIVSGTMTVGLDNETMTAKPGDAVFIPAGTAHWYENRGQEALVFLCLIPRTATYETEWV